MNSSPSVPTGEPGGVRPWDEPVELPELLAAVRTQNRALAVERPSAALAYYVEGVSGDLFRVTCLNQSRAFCWRQTIDGHETQQLLATAVDDGGDVEFGKPDDVLPSRARPEGSR